MYSQEDALKLIRDACIKLGSSNGVIRNQIIILEDQVIGVHHKTRYCRPDLMVGIWALSFLLETYNITTTRLCYVSAGWDGNETKRTAWTIKCDDWNEFCMRLKKLIDD